MKYAIVESGGKQYKAVEGGTLEVDRLPEEPGTNIKLEKVLLLADEGNITVGVPIIKDNPVWTKVLEHFKGEKAIIFNYSPKKRIRVKTGHRQNYTRLLVEQIGGSELVVKKAVPKIKEEKEEEPKAKVKAPAAKAAAAPAKKAEPKAAAKTSPTKEKTAAKKPAAKPAPAKVEKPAKTAEKPAKTSTKKPAPSAKKPAEKK